MLKRLTALSAGAVLAVVMACGPTANVDIPNSSTSSSSGGASSTSSSSSTSASSASSSGASSTSSSSSGTVETMFSVGGMVTGLAMGTSVSLQNNMGDTVNVSANGAFSFPTKLMTGAMYSVTVSTQPTGPKQVCTVTTGAGTIANMNVSNVSVTCALARYSIGGTVAGLPAGSNVVLQNNLGDDLSVSMNGMFTFATTVAVNSMYAVTVKTPPAGMRCSVTSPTGTVVDGPVTGVVVTCANAQGFLLAEWNNSHAYSYDPVMSTNTLNHTTLANDFDCNAAQGSNELWYVQHNADKLGHVTYSTSTGDGTQVALPYAYGKHVAVFANSVYVMSRNDSTLYRYSFAGVQTGSVVVPGTSGQGIATDGTLLYVSTWNGTVSSIRTYNSDLVAQAATYTNPTGMTENNLVDFAYDPLTRDWVGIVATGEGGTGTSSTKAIRFTFGGSVTATYTLPITASGIGRNACP